MGFAKPIEQYLFSNLLIRIHVFMYLKDIIRGKNVYEAFNTFELQDVSHMNVVDRHLEQSEIWDSSLYERIFQKEENVEKAKGSFPSLFVIPA